MGTAALLSERVSQPHKVVGKAAARPAQSPSTFPKTTTWGREFMRRLDALHQALELEGKKLSWPCSQNIVMVSDNTKEFSRVPGLVLENWRL